MTVNPRSALAGIQIIFYLLFGNNMIAMSFMLSSVFSSSRTSTVVSFIYVFATGLLGELLFRVSVGQPSTHLAHSGHWAPAVYTDWGIGASEPRGPLTVECQLMHRSCNALSYSIQAWS